jgi:hypothetical protein
MSKPTVFGLAVTRPRSNVRAIVTGFNSKAQAQAIGKMRRYIKESVSNPRVIVNPNVNDYEYHFQVTQEELYNEVLSCFYLNDPLITTKKR